MTEEDSNDDGGGLGEQLRRLLEALDALERDESAHASASGSPLGLDVDVDVEFGTLDDASEASRDSSRRTRRSRRRAAARSRRSTTDADYVTSVREREDGATVSVDLGAEPSAAPTPAVEDGELVLHRKGGVVETVPLPFADGVVAGASTNNGVLVVEVRRRQGTDADGDAERGADGDAS